MQKGRYEHLFATPVAFFDNVLNNREDVVRVAGDVYSYYTNHPRWKDAISNHAGATTHWFTNEITQQFPGLNTVYDQVQPYADQYAKALAKSQNVTVKPVMSWLTFYDQNSLVMKHNHAYYLRDGMMGVMNINAIMYLQVEATDKLDLYDPSPLMQVGHGKITPSLKTASCTLAENSLILMPAWLDHGVEPRVRTRQKIIMSINYQYRNLDTHR